MIFQAGLTAGVAREDATGCKAIEEIFRNPDSFRHQRTPAELLFQKYREKRV